MTKSVKPRREGFSLRHYGVLIVSTLLVALVCVCLGSVAIAPEDALSVLWQGARGQQPGGLVGNIILKVRLPRVLSVAAVGAALSLCGAAMQGLLKNPLADGSTLGVSSGASLGAVLALAFGVTVPGLPQLGVMGVAMLFAFLSLLIILGLAWRVDASFATHTIILIGVIFSMFASALISLVITFSGERLRSITFWTMGSLAASGYQEALLMGAALMLVGGGVLLHARALNAFAVGEDNARSVGVNVRGVKMRVLMGVAALIGIAVSIGGSIGFVGLVTPHMARLVVGPNHHRLLPASLFGGAIFLMLADLLARTALSPLELPIGVVTSLAGALLFLTLFVRKGRAG